jgi:hypothetical protein
MTRVADGARLLRYLVADGPIPSSAGRQAWATNGMPADDERLLTAALRRAGIKPEHHGHPGVAQRWWWRAPGDDRPIGGNIKPHECTACKRILNLPDSPRLCISTPRCPGHYEPSPWLTQATSGSHHVSSRQIDLSAWRSRPSPLHAWRVSRANVRRPAPRWR